MYKNRGNRVAMMLAVLERSAFIPSLMLSASLHLAILFLGGRMLFQPVQYGIEIGRGGMEVYLVAAPPRPVSAGGAGAALEPLPASSTDDGLVLPKPAAMAGQSSSPSSVEQTRAKGQLERHSPFTGDGSSPVPGQDPTTFYSVGGGQTDAKPGYLKNPVPSYPPTARRLGQEGVVVLLIGIDPTGHPTRVEVQQSSGHPTLDESALTTVRRWKFTPARAAGIPVPSVANLRVHFILREKEIHS